MQITLENFRFHKNKTVELPDVGLISLSGESGSGKTTVLHAIVFVLYGKIPGKAKKPYTHGKKGTASVNLIYLKLNITRTARPNRLLVVKDQVEYEDDAAQCIINDTLNMNYDEFMAGAYIIQRSNSSVLSMTPTEQLKFVEVLSQSEKVEEYKSAIKEFIKEKNTTKVHLQGSKTTINTQIEEKIEILGDEPEIPLALQEGYSPDDLKEEISCINIQITKINKILLQKQKNLNNLRSKEKNSHDIRNKMNKLVTEIELHTKRLKELQKCQFEDIDDLESLKESIKQIERIEEYENLSNNFKIAEKEHISHQKQQRENLEAQILDLLGDFKNIEDMEIAFEEEETLQRNYIEQKKMYEESIKIKEEGRKKLSSIFQKIKKQYPSTSSIKTASAMTTELRRIGLIPLVCPECSSNVSLDPVTKTLIKNNIPEECAIVHDVSQFITEINEAAKKLNITIKKLGVPPDFTDLSKRVMKIRRLIDAKQNLNDTLPLVLIKMKKNLDDMEKEIESFEKGNLQELISEVKRKEEIFNLKLQNENEQKRIQKEIKIQKQHLDKLPSLDSQLESQIKTLEKEISSHTRKIMDLTSQISSKREILDSMSEYLLYQNKLKEIEDLKENITELNESLETLDTEIEGFIGLGDTVKEAELITLEEIIKSINEHAKIYLDQMFEDPIDVRLECIKEVKSRKTFKLQMNTVIDHRGERYGDIEELSGGERQRCDMAFLLAINDMLGSNILLLDECLNNLNSEINTDVLTLVRDFCSGHKLIVVVSHEAVKGIFDSEIHI